MEIKHAKAQASLDLWPSARNLPFASKPLAECVVKFGSYFWIHADHVPRFGSSIFLDRFQLSRNYYS